MTGEPLILVALVAVLFLGSWGWGRAVAGLLVRWGWDDATKVLTPALQVVVGMALFLGVGGVLVAVGVAYFGVLLAWHLVGALLLVPVLPASARRARALPLGARLGAIAMTAVGVFLVALAFGEAVGVKLYNPVDDDGAYVYLAKRLLVTGGLTDPFSLRRITSYGGSELYQAMFLQATGNAPLRAAELIFATAVIFVLVVGHTRRRWPALGAIVLGVGLILGRGEGPVANLSPNFSVAALSLGVFLMLRHVAPRAGRERILFAAVIGVLLAGILALREYFLVSVVITLVVVVVVAVGWRGVIDLGVVVAAGALTSVGWAVALWRSSGTPLFPLVTGNYNRAWPSGGDPTLQGVAAYWHRYLLTFDGNAIGWVAVIAVGVGAVYWISRTRPPMQMLVLCTAGVGCLLEMAALSYIFSGSVPNDVVRFVAPSTLACGLLTVDALWPAPRLALASRASKSPSAASRERPMSLGGVPHVVLGAPVVTAAVALGAAGMLFGWSVSTFVSQTGNRLQRAVHVVGASAPMADRYRSSEAQYHAVNRLIPAGATVLAAVDFPALLDMDRFRFASLDFAGAVSPPPHLPFLEGAGPTVAYLRSLGYGYIAVQSPGRTGIYYYRLYVRDMRLQVYFDREDAPDYFAWEKAVTTLERSGRYPVARAGDISVIDIEPRR